MTTGSEKPVPIRGAQISELFLAGALVAIQVIAIPREAAIARNAYSALQFARVSQVSCK
jgi:hypothetical protein